jgi:MFS family permease
VDEPDATAIVEDLVKAQSRLTLSIAGAGACLLAVVVGTSAGMPAYWAGTPPRLHLPAPLLTALAVAYVWLAIASSAASRRMGRRGIVVLGIALGAPLVAMWLPFLLSTLALAPILAGISVRAELDQHITALGHLFDRDGSGLTAAEWHEQQTLERKLLRVRRLLARRAR